VDGRNPAPVDRWFISLFIGFQPFKVVQDFATIRIRRLPFAAGSNQFQSVPAAQFWH